MPEQELVAAIARRELSTAVPRANSSLALPALLHRIESLLVWERGLRLDEGVEHQRRNCINVILSAIREAE